MNDTHRWDTEEFEKRTKELYRTEIHKLYPSEAWCLYRIIPDCRTVLDLGCGNGAMAKIIQQISSTIEYTGVDHQEKLMNEAKELFPPATFHAADLMDFISTCSHFDGVMSWSVIKSFQNWRELIGKMIFKAQKYVMFDIRVANVEKEIWDENVCWADYSGRKGPIIVLNYSIFKEGIMGFSDRLEKMEIAAYQSGFGKYVHFSGKEPEQFILSVVLKRKHGRALNQNQPCSIYEQLPGNLRR
ncbi:MAG: class I SAM-dependent methyltransferase [Nitrospinaceae bacterium]|jgi:SAM-dependent methyltransferase|nr:hypothetical protein [Rhodospirillaceae bacterium]MDP6478394.1 class I SAM-dependent methyltransferase [Nitrospinaceae bacterium]|tara:strand:+ start:8764 stop:9492 length:729 start_codon:yes stop_codon:yes gene_type:complete